MSSINIIQVGNIFESDAQTIVNTVNCVGAMGKGLALQYKKRYPSMFKAYVRLCENGLLDIGKLWLYKTDSRWILNFPTKYHWRHPSKEEYLESSLQKFLDTYKEKGITSIAFPLLGASNGGIHPDVSLKIMRRYLDRCEIPVTIYLDYNRSDPGLFEEKLNKV